MSRGHAYPLGLIAGVLGSSLEGRAEGSAAWMLCPPALWAWNQGPGESSAPDPPALRNPSGDRSLCSLTNRDHGRREWEAGLGGLLGKGGAGPADRELPRWKGQESSRPGKRRKQNMVRKSRTEPGAQLSSVPLRGSQGTGSAGTAHEGCQAQTWSRGRSEAPRRPGQSPESPGHLPRRQRQGCQLRESSDGPGGEALRLPRR